MRVVQMLFPSPVAVYELPGYRWDVRVLGCNADAGPAFYAPIVNRVYVAVAAWH